MLCSTTIQVYQVASMLFKFCQSALNVLDDKGTTTQFERRYKTEKSAMKETQNMYTVKNIMLITATKENSICNSS